MRAADIPLRYLVSISIVEFKCSMCEKPAFLTVEQTNKDLDKRRYMTDGTRSAAFCRDHAPANILEQIEITKQSVFVPP